MAKRSARRSITRRSKKNMRTRRSKRGMRKTRSKKNMRTRRSRRNMRNRRSRRTMRGGMSQLRPHDLSEQPMSTTKCTNHTTEPNNLGQQGGGLMPRPLVDLGRGIKFSLQKMADTYRGEPTPLSKNPDVLDQDLKMKTNYSLEPTDIGAIDRKSQLEVASYTPYNV